MKAIPVRYSVRYRRSIVVNGVSIQGLNAQHGPIEYSLFGIKQWKIPGPEERAGFGATGFQMQLNNKTIVNLGDSLLQKE